MAVHLTAPGVYVVEVPSGVHTITGVATSVAAFVGYTAKGRDNIAKRVLGFPDFERNFGGLARDSELSYAVSQFFDNGGGEAYVVRVPGKGAKPAALKILNATGGADTFRVTALSSGAWGKGMLVDVDFDGIAPADARTFNLTITDPASGAVESFQRVSADKTKNNFVGALVNDEDNGSKLVTVEMLDNTKRPAPTGTVGGAIAVDADGKPTGIDAGKNMRVKVTIDRPGAVVADRIVTVFGKGEAAPDSIPALCRLLERRINTALNGDATVSCTPLAIDKDKLAIRVVAAVRDIPDASIKFASGDVAAADDADADPVLKLKTGSVNVAHYWLGTDRALPALAVAEMQAGTDGTGLPETGDLIGDPGKFTGIFALEKVDLFNILCIPDATRAPAGNPTARDTSVDFNSVFQSAVTYCESRRAFLLIDPPPDVIDIDGASDWKALKLKVHNKNAAAYFPRLKLADPLNGYQLRSFAPSGVLAGLYARIDAARGVWKAPAGVEATLNGVQGVAYKMSDAENGVLNPIGLNCIRVFPIYGPISWGARTLVGADVEGSEWKYVPVRRFALFLEESLFRGTKWAVFEPNDEPLWAQLRLNIGAFMQTLFRQGAFQGRTPREAYFVKCDNETTTQDDINRGVVNILVGFAPLKPAEFVIIQVQQMAGQIQT
jgi:phage tail sheath protein FI